MGRRTIPDQTAILSFETSTSRYLENSFSRTVYRRRSSILRGTGGRACEWSSVGGEEKTPESQLAVGNLVQELTAVCETTFGGYSRSDITHIP